MEEQRCFQKKGGWYTLQKLFTHNSLHLTLRAVRMTSASPETKPLKPDKRGSGLCFSGSPATTHATFCSLARISEGMKWEQLFCCRHDFPCPHDAVHLRIFMFYHCYSRWRWDRVKHPQPPDENKDTRMSHGWHGGASETFRLGLFLDNRYNWGIVTYSSWWRQNCWPLPDCQCEASAWIRRCQTEPFLSETRCILDPRPLETGPL